MLGRDWKVCRVCAAQREMTSTSGEAPRAQEFANDSGTKGTAADESNTAFWTSRSFQVRVHWATERARL